MKISLPVLFVCALLVMSGCDTEKSQLKASKWYKAQQSWVAGRTNTILDPAREIWLGSVREIYTNVIISSTGSMTLVIFRPAVQMAGAHRDSKDECTDGIHIDFPAKSIEYNVGDRVAVSCERDIKGQRWAHSYHPMKLIHVAKPRQTTAVGQTPTRGPWQAEINSSEKVVEPAFNPEIQSVAEQTINETVGSFHAAGGLVLVQDVKTGRILAMASSTNGQYSGVNTVFEPGTLFKPMILAAAMNERLVTPCATTNSGVNIFEYGNKTLQCHVPTEVEGSIKYTLALSNSEVFHKIGLMLGDKRIEEYCRRFNFGSKLNCGLPSECEGFIDVDRDRNKRIASRISIGYGVGVTALQMINAYSCIANDGILMRPSFGQCPTLEIMGRPITQETAHTMKDLLRITEEVQGKEMFESLHGLPAAGQVGMAQKKNNGYYLSDEYYVTFAGFVPVDNPVFCVFVLVDAPKPLRTGGIVAFPAFAKISIATARVLSVSKLSINSNRKEKIKEGPN